MSNPEVAEKIGGYELSWKEEKLRIPVTRIRQHRDNRVTGWLMIISTSGKEKLLHQCELNFASTQTQKTLAKSLTERYGKYKWDDIIEQLRYYILERVRKGEPVQSLMTEDAPSGSLPYLVYPILPQGQATVMYGEPGVGKSWMALIIYISLLLPWHDNPLGLKVPDHSTRSLIIDYETEYDIALRRARKLQEGMGLPPFELYYRRCINTVPDDIEQIQIALEEVGAECLIVDSLASASGGDLLSAEVAGSYFSALRRLNVTSFTIGQTQKDPDKKRKTIFGSTIYEYYSRSIWEAKKSQTVGEDEIHVAIHHRKANESKLHHSLGYRLYFNEDKTMVFSEDIRKVPEFHADMSLRARITEELAHGPLTAKEIADNIDGNSGTISKTLSNMKHRKEVVKLSSNKWGLAAKD